MSRGIVDVRFAPDAAVSAPASGVQLGIGEGGPVTLRLFRLSGTPVVFASALAPAQLIAIRVAAAGTPVHVLTGRPQFWQPLLPAAGGLHAISPSEQPQPPGGPSLLIEDRPAQLRTPAEAYPWQCRLDVRTEWSPADLPSFAYTDVAAFGGIPVHYAQALAAAFRVPEPQAARLTRLEPGTVGVFRRGQMALVALNATDAELSLLDQARGAAPAAPIWR